jgi:hypothetical protein
VSSIQARSSKIGWKELNSRRIATWKDQNMEAYLAVLVFFGGCIGLGIAISVILYNFGAFGKQHLRYRRYIDKVDLLVEEDDSEELLEEEDLRDVS